jgi:hypothetical protein
MCTDISGCHIRDYNNKGKKGVLRYCFKTTVSSHWDHWPKNINFITMI